MLYRREAKDLERGHRCRHAAEGAALARQRPIAFRPKALRRFRVRHASAEFDTTVATDHAYRP
jgi:hypothetical protein